VDSVFASALEQARLVREGAVSATELVEHALERIGRLDPELNAFVTVCADDALDAARVIDDGTGDEPFRGVPIAIKDLSATAGIRTTYSSRAFAAFVPDLGRAVLVLRGAVDRGAPRTHGRRRGRAPRRHGRLRAR